MRHWITGEELSAGEIERLLRGAQALKQERAQAPLRRDLEGCFLAMLFDKPSLRTRFSFTIAMKELGGDVVESTGDTRKAETPQDQARVLSGYCHAILVRTHADEVLTQMGQATTVPVINGLSDGHHPCQTLADLLTLQETFGVLRGLTVCYVGDGNNVLHSLLLLAPRVGVSVRYCCPAGRAPRADILARCEATAGEGGGTVQAFPSPAAAVEGADAVYTDVWTSMGFEARRADALFEGFQVTEALMARARPHAIFMHCLPMERGKEVSETLPDRPCSVVFRQSENRLHVQKALLLFLIKGVVS